MRSIGKHRFALLFVCAIALQAFVGLVAAELILRIIDLRYLRLETSANTLPYQHDPEIGWVPIANSVSAFTGSRKIAVQQNSLGLRDLENDGSEKPAIMFVGDSFVWGYDVEADERFTELLRRRLPQYRIVNAGVAGYATDQEYLFLRRLWSKTTPQVVVLIFCNSNDRADNSTNLGNDDFFKPYIEQTAPGDWQFRGQPVPRSRYHDFRHNWLARNLLSIRLMTSAYVHFRHPAVKVADPTEHLVGMMRDFVEQRGARFLVGSLTSDPQLESFMRKQKIPYASLDGAWQYRDDGSHWTPAGHVVVAQRLRRLLTKAGLLADDTQDDDITIADYDQVIRNYPRDAFAVVGRGNVYAAAGRFERAIIEYKEAIRIDPGNVIAFHMLGAVHHASGNLDRALADLNEAIRLRPATPVLLTARGQVYADRKDYEHAIADFTEALRHDPGFAAARDSLELAYRAMGDRDGARAQSDRR